MKDYFIRRAHSEDAKQVAEFFRKNYGEDYCEGERFFTEEYLRELFSQSAFIGVLSFFKEGNSIVGFCGTYIDLKNDITRVYLGNLLVDSEYRGSGIGNKISNEREKIIGQLSEKMSIFGRCVEKPEHSIRMKEKDGYQLLGVNFLRCSCTGNRNLILMGKNTGLDEKQIFYHGSSITNALIKKVKREKALFKEDRETHFLGGIKKIVKNGIETSFLEYKKSGDHIAKIVEEIVAERGYGATFGLRPQERGFFQADKALIEHGFFPVSLLPYLSEEADDFIEYQYICSSKLDDLPDPLPNKKEIIEYFNTRSVR